MRVNLSFPTALILCLAAGTSYAQTPAVVSLTITPGSIAGGSEEVGTGTVTVAPAPSVNTGVHFTIEPSGVVTIFEGGTVLAGQTTATFKMKSISTVTQARTATITAELGGGQASESVTVTPLVITVSVNPNTLVAGAQPPQTADLAVSLSAPIIPNAVIHVSTDSFAAGGPGDVRLLNGQNQTYLDAIVPFPVSNRVVVTITVRFGVNEGTTTIAILPLRCLNDPNAAGCEPPEPPPPPPPPPPPSRLRVRAAIPGGAPEEKEMLSGETVSAHFPLGTAFTIEVFKVQSDGSAAPFSSTFTPGAATKEPGVVANALFADFVVFKYAESTPLRGSFQTIHKGTVPILITSEDQTLSVTVNVVVENPARLGTSEAPFPRFQRYVRGLYRLSDAQFESYLALYRDTLDGWILEEAHEKGIPPQYIKGQIERESAFYAMTFRYEPISPAGDLGAVSGDGTYGERRRAGKGHLRRLAPFRFYRLATAADDVYDPNLSEGGMLTQEDVDPRNVLQVTFGTEGEKRFIASGDIFVSALNIYTSNPRWNWARENPRNARAVADNPRILDFTAQTTIASSYGLLQMLYGTAIQVIAWQGIGGAQNPRFLFDSVETRQQAAGSLELGTAYLVTRYPATLVSFQDYPALEESFRAAFQRYNQRADRYGEDVIGRSKSYDPVSGGSIFR